MSDYPDRILRLPQVVETTGLSRTRIYNLVASGDFPPPIKLSERAIGWQLSVIQEWIRQRALMTAARRTKREAADFLAKL